MARVKRTTFVQNFRPDLGDLVYGASQGGVDWRQRYIQQLPAEVQAGLTDDVFYTIDQYNNNLGLFSPVDHFKNMDERVERRGEGEKRLPITPQQASYYTGIRSSDSNPRQVFQKSPEMALKLKKEGYGALVEEGILEEAHATPFARQYKMVRMACKYGIAHFVQLHRSGVHDAVIHFILDGLDTHDVVHKVKRKGHMGRVAVPITYSELRSCYRNWDEYQGCVWLYRDYEVTAPPWGFAGSRWEDYAEARQQKHTRLVRHIQQAVAEYRKYPLLHWNKTRNTKEIIGFLDILIDRKVDYNQLKQYVRWFLGFSGARPQGYIITSAQLTPASRFRGILERHYLAWCNGA